MNNDELRKKIIELENIIKDKDQEIHQLKESEMALADANVRIAELFMDLEEAQEQIIDQKNEILQQNEELSEHIEELSLINEQLNIAQTLNENLHKQQIQADIIKKAHQRILSSIHYAQNIQKSIFPSSHRLKDNIKSYFKFFSPKDLVGGDFYWTTHVNKKSFLIVGDCTGHGVPGAFMTLIGIALLERTINVLKVHDPAKILKTMDALIIRLLRQNRTESHRDSIDMTIFLEDRERDEVIISSAKRCFIRSNYNKELESLKGDRNPVGDTSIAEKIFSNHHFPRRQGDRYYMYSDGITDQFGGPRDKKLGNKRLIQFLSSIQDQQLFQQQIQFEEFLKDWMKDQHQIDDMVFFGVEIT
ncbi:SpoIIE family protein phosphatase [Flammeovirga sp. SubArs3]|uniref:PP2C family protein-serine/threonine phosphatase n=1 Tax=Flammeovirga sp. SubArs3 TaxID=2995316 RepID=UPI00248BAFCD|nr:SpoIIE family protein phosphatase [Flammeovirga sp. SubArs3]